VPTSLTLPVAEDDIPATALRLAGDARVEPVWRNAIGGVTIRATSPQSVVYIKVGPRNLETSFEDEAARLEWAHQCTTVPRVVLHGRDDDQEWLVTEALPGDNAVSERWLGEPATAVRAIGAGLRALHGRLPVDDCPFSWDVPSRLANAEVRGVAVPEELRTPPPVDQLVVCHGDACAPNTLIGPDGTCTGHVDLGALGVGDRWADIAVAAMSAGWNYGPGWEETLVEAYGVPFDRERMAYYQALWNAT
jgi:kanamycin kinase